MKKELFLLVFLTGCTVGPNYKKPEIQMPVNYAERVTSENGLETLKNWWETFDDPILNELIDTAISNSYSLKIALEKIEETRSYFRLKRADLFPEVDLNAAVSRESYSKNMILTSLYPVTAFNTFQLGFDAIWEVDIFGKLKREKEAAYYQFQASQENMRDVYITLISDVARYYVDICTVQNIIDLTNKKIRLQKEIFRLSSNLNSTGIDSKINEEEQLAQLKQEEESLEFYNTYLKQSSYSLAVLLGKNPEQIIEKIAEFKKIPETIDKIKVGMPSTLLRRRPDIRKAERELAASTAKVGSAIADYFPSFSLTGSTYLEANKINRVFSGNSFQWGIGSFFNWPILTFGRIRSKVDMMKSQEKQSLFIYENTILDALRDVESALSAYYNEEKKLMEIKTEVGSYSKIAAYEENKYRNGLINLSRFFESEKILIQSQVKEIESKRALAHNLIALYKAMGGGDW